MLDSQRNKVLIFQAEVNVKHCTTVFVLETVVFNFQVGGTEWTHTYHATQVLKNKTYIAAPQIIAIADLKIIPFSSFHDTN